MATPNQIAANRANAQKSTGPRTEEGKAKSSRNHLSHGFTASAAVIPGEDQAEFDALVADLMAEHRPATLTEQILVETMAQNRWLALRAFRLQANHFRFSLAICKLDVPSHLGLLIRYHSTAERAFHRAHAELLKARKEGQNSEIGFESQKPAQPPAEAPKAAPATASVTPEWAAFTNPSAPPAPETLRLTAEFIQNAA